MSAPHRSDLPILDELERDYRQLVATELAEPAAAARTHERSPRARPAAAPRVMRRASVVLVLICLVGTVAFAARVGLRGGGAVADSDPVVLGRAAGVEVDGHRHAGRLCLLLSRAGELADACGAPPARHAVRAGSIVADGRVVAGFAGAAVARVRVAVGGRNIVVATRAPADRAAAEDAGVPRGTRWFAARVRHGGAAALAPARVSPLDADGRQNGPTALDCSVSVVAGACKHATQRTAGALEDRDG